jgi:hypothetical protein
VLKGLETENLNKIDIPTFDIGEEEQYNVSCEVWDLGQETDTEDDDDI